MTETADRDWRIGHVDTTALFDLQKVSRYREATRDTLSRFDFLTVSSFSRRAFKKSWLQRHTTILGLSRKQTVKTINDLFVEIDHTFRSKFSGRDRDTCRQIMNSLIEATPRLMLDSASSLKRVQRRLNERVRQLASDYDALEMTRLDGTACVRANEELYSELPNGDVAVHVKECSVQDIRCEVHEFFRAESGHMAAVHSALIQSNPKHDLGPDLAAAMQDPISLCDGKRCVKLEDVLIAVDGKQSTHFVANNERDWGPISSALNKELINPYKLVPASKRKESVLRGDTPEKQADHVAGG